MTTTTRASLTIRALTKRFADTTVLHDIDLTVTEGEFIAIVGHSGCGKSTLLRVISGLETPTVGTVERDDPAAVGFQDSRLVPWQKVWRNVVFGLRGSKRELRAKALAVLAEVGLEEFADVWPHTLSGGQAQRVSLARALTLNPRILLLDEPFGALDALTRLNAQDLVCDLWLEHGFTTVLVTHDVDEAVFLADRVLVMREGRIADEIVIDELRPRGRSDPRLIAYRDRILTQLGIADSIHPEASSTTPL